MYFLDKLELEHLVIHELNVIGGILEKSKIYGADFVSMVCFWVIQDGTRKSVQDRSGNVQGHQKAKLPDVISHQKPSC